MNRPSTAAAALRALLLWSLLCIGGGAGALAAESKNGPVIEPANGPTCVEDPATMRRKHPEFLKHQRDDTVHGGIRGAKYSLKGCVDCHASRTTQSVTAAPTNFCVSCHSYAAVRIDCFECHSHQPRSVSGTATAPAPTPAVTRQP